MNSPGHVMILASAGSGKTYALTDRFVQLLAGGAAPERIAALTFTRKAAGEFFDEILGKLARAAEDAAAAKKLATAIGRPDLGPVDFRTMLRAVTDAMHRLNLGTLDSFFARVVRAFPLELGLGGDFEILRGHAEQLERRRVLRQHHVVSRAWVMAIQPENKGGLLRHEIAKGECGAPLPRFWVRGAGKATYTGSNGLNTYIKQAAPA